jgi:PBSX family phage terminase large subunit
MMTDVDSKVRIALKYRPLFKLLDETFHPEIDTVIITGGRYSLKSYTVSIFSLLSLVHYQWNTLYTRFTNMSIVDSVKPEVSDKIELMGFDGIVQNTQSHIEYNGNRISFKGIKTGSLGQTANLKSLSGFNLFVNDEAEELPDYKTFKKIFYSIRSATKRNLTILILNPTTKEHWIFKEFFEKKGLTGGDNCIKDNVMYIHSSYLDADQAQIPKNILADYNRLKTEDPKEYENIVLGGWVAELEGQIFPERSLKRYKEFPENMEYFTIAAIDTADEGDNFFSMPIARVYGNRVYIFDAIFDQDNLTIQESQVQSKVKEDRINEAVVETNSFGAYFSRRIRELIPDLEVFGQPAKANKMGRIIAQAGLIKRHFYFPENPNETLKKFMDQLIALLKTSTEFDDAADSLAEMSAYLEHYHGLFKEEL